MSEMRCEVRHRGALVAGVVGLLVVVLAWFGPLASRALASRGVRDARTAPSHQSIQVAAYGRLPLSFTQNHGQAPVGVDYVADGVGWSLGLGRDGVQLALGSRHSERTLRVLTPDGRLRSPIAEQRLSDRVNYFGGPGRGQWLTGSPTFGRVVYRNVWPGIDLAFHGHNGTLEYDFDLAPGADPSQVMLRFAGARAIRPDGRGGAVITLSGNSLRIAAPRAVQDSRAVLSRLVVNGDSIRLALGAYDPHRALVVDPALVYLTDLGGGYAAANGIAVDAAGDAYVTGNTGTENDDGHAFVTKLSPTGHVVYSTYLGGTSSVTNLGVVIDGRGDAYVTGGASSTNFPTTQGAYQTSFGGGSDAFVAKLNGTGGLVYATYLGGSGTDLGNGIAVDASGDAYVTGDTGSTNFPVSPGAYQRSAAGGFVTKLNPTGSALLYSTYLSVGDARAIAVDSTGDAYVTGDAGGSLATTAAAYETKFGGGNFDAFVVKLNPTGSGVVYSTHLGGGSNEVGTGIAIDPSGDAFVSGWTNSSDFPATRGAYQTSYSGPGDDGFVTELNPSGSAALYSTYLGGHGGNSAGGIAVNSVGDAYVTGETTSSQFPTTPDAYQASYKGPAGQPNAFVTKLGPAGNSLLYSTYLPQNVGSGIAVDPNGDAYVADVSYSEAWAVKLGIGGVASGLRIVPHTFPLTGRRVGSRCVKATHANQGHQKCVRPIRLHISYELSAPARLAIKLLRILPGRLLKLRCVKPPAKNRGGGYCMRLAPVHGTLTVNGHPGVNHFTFKGRMGGRKLTPGLYQLTATPTVSGHADIPLTTTFTIAS